MLKQPGLTELNEPALSPRDEFAKAAMEAMLTSAAIHQFNVDMAGLAQKAYDMADAMMEQREKRP